jgi:hypothetical protein
MGMRGGFTSALGRLVSLLSVLAMEGLAAVPPVDLTLTARRCAKVSQWAQSWAF